MAEPCDECLAARVGALEQSAQWRALAGWLVAAAVLAALVYAVHAGWVTLTPRGA